MCRSGPMQFKGHCTFSTLSFIKFKSRSNTSDEDLMSKLKCPLEIKYIPDFEDLIWEKVM